VGLRLHAFFQAAHVLLRPLGNTIYVMPPYCVTGDDLDKIYGAIGAAAEALI
jgi:adenosylmethionine-8-amino-7-oxononanoate aminotransferase